MLSLSTRSQAAIGAALVALLVVTRGYHFATLAHVLPSASWAVFFLAGVYLRPVWAPALLFGVAAALDFGAVTWGGVSDFCVSPAYIALLPAYGALWLAGRWYAGRYRFAATTLVPLTVSAAAGTLVCELMSSGAFYFYSSRFTQPTLGEFADLIAQYFPAALASMAFWIGVAALVHVAVVTAQRRVKLAA